MVLSPGLTLKQKALFFHQFAALLNSGLPLQQSLGLAANEMNARFQRELKSVSVAIAQGQDLSTALTNYPVFDNWTLTLLKTAEYSGSLAVTCKRIAIAAEREQHQGRLYRSVTLSVLSMLLSGLFAITTLIQGNLNFLTQPGFWMSGLLGVGLLAIAVNQLGSDSLNLHLQRLLLKLPIVGKLRQAQAMLYFTELELPLSCGVPILAALDLVRARMPDPDVAASLTQAVRKIQSGQNLTQSLQGKLPSLALQMIRTGEESGDLETMLQKLATYYEGELERTIRQLQGTLKPLSILAMGGAVLVGAIQSLSALLNSLPG
ncbi:MAG: type II secretion system F family protein [Leptolyngbyaceae bacterium]|nr:type II secretion system F family protein [Leptolyngbyaceae bacterium]